MTIAVRVLRASLHMRSGVQRLNNIQHVIGVFHVHRRLDKGDRSGINNAMYVVVHMIRT